MNPIKTKKITIKARVLSFGERVQQYRLERQAAVKAIKAAKRNKKLLKADKEAIEAQLSAPEND